MVIICPTRELASQAAKEATMLMTFQKGLGVQVVIGGTNMNSETKRLGNQPCQVITILYPDLQSSVSCFLFLYRPCSFLCDLVDSLSCLPLVLPWIN